MENHSHISIRRFESIVNDQNLKITHLNEENSSLHQQLVQSNNTKIRLCERLSSIQAECDSFMEVKNSLQNEVSSLSNQLNMAFQELDSCKISEAKLSEENVNLSNELLNLQTLSKNLLTKLTDKEATIERLCTKIFDVEKDLENEINKNTSSAFTLANNLCSEIINNKSFFEEEKPIDVVKRDGFEQCTYTGWIEFIKANRSKFPLLGSFIEGIGSVAETMIPVWIDESTPGNRVHNRLIPSEIDCIRYQHKSVAYSAAHLVSLFCHKWKWTMSFVTNDLLYKESQSSIASDFIGHILPGSYSTRQLDNIETNRLAELLSNKVYIPHATFVVNTYDNVGGQHQAGKAARAGKSIEREWNETSTASTAYCFKDDDMLQYNVTYSPEYDLQWRELDNVELGIRSEPDIDNPEGKSDQDYVEEYIVQIIKVAAQEVLSKDIYKIEPRGEINTTDATNVIIGEKGLEEVAGYNKKCCKLFDGIKLGCLKYNKNRSTLCKFCESALPTLPQLRAQFGDSKGVNQSSKKKKVRRQSLKKKRKRETEGNYTGSFLSWNYHIEYLSITISSFL
jgi:hypothetical protein